MAIRAKSADQVVDRAEPALATWQPPAIVVAVSIAIVGAFYVGGPGFGLAIGALAAAAIIVMAARAAPRGPIVPAPLRDLRHHILLISRDAIEDPTALAQVAELYGDLDPDPVAGELRLLVPVRERLLDRWCSDRAAYSIAQRNCVISLATLVGAGLEATATVGDGDIVQAVEDELRTYPATDVVMLTRTEELAAAEQSATELRRRLQAEFLQLPVRASSPVNQSSGGGFVRRRLAPRAWPRGGGCRASRGSSSRRGVRRPARGSGEEAGERR
jgi:hypothetical protein